MNRFCALADKELTALHGGLAALQGVVCALAISGAIVGAGSCCAAAEPGKSSSPVGSYRSPASSAGPRQNASPLLAESEPGQSAVAKSATTRESSAKAGAIGKAAVSADDRQRESIVDLRQFAVPAGARFTIQTAAELEVAVPLAPLAAFDFYEAALGRAGWIVIGASRKTTGAESARAYFERAGVTLSLSVGMGDSPRKSEVALRDRGDFDTERLPRLAGSQLVSHCRPLTVFMSNESVAVVAKALARLLPAAGWRSYKEMDAGTVSAGSRMLWFRQSRDSLTVSIVPTKVAGGQTRVSYSVYRMAHHTPTPADARDVELQDASWQARCRAPGGLASIADFYRREMAACGFKSVAASGAKPGEKLLRFEGEDRSTVLVSLASIGQTTTVTLQGMSAEQLAAAKAAERRVTKPASESPERPIYAQDLPLPADAKQVKFASKKQEITFQLPCRTAQAEAERKLAPIDPEEDPAKRPSELEVVIKELGAKLTDAGWVEKKDATLIAESAGLAEFEQGDASLLIMLDQAAQGAETAVTITGKGISWR